MLVRFNAQTNLDSCICISLKYFFFDKNPYIQKNHVKNKTMETKKILRKKLQLNKTTILNLNSNPFAEANPTNTNITNITCSCVPTCGGVEIPTIQ